jgi:hypothetical protein
LDSSSDTAQAHNPVERPERHRRDQFRLALLALEGWVKGSGNMASLN